MYLKHNIAIIISTTAKPYSRYCMVESDNCSLIGMLVVLVMMVTGL